MPENDEQSLMLGNSVGLEHADSRLLRVSETTKRMVTMGIQEKGQMWC